MTTVTQQYKVGDRVRVVLEGEVLSPGPVSGAFYLGTAGDSMSANYVEPGRQQVVTIEKLKQALPTTPGSVVRIFDGGSFRFLSRNGKWLTESGVLLGAGLSDPDDYDVVFDAGGSK